MVRACVNNYMRSVVYRIPEKEFRDLIRDSRNYTDVLRKLDLSSTGSSQKILKRRIKELDLDVSHFQHYDATGAAFKNTLPLERVLVENSNYNTYTLKNRLLREGLIENKCQECGLKGEWNSKPLKLQLDHINGVSNDHRIENLRLLCPNCHSQTETWCGKREKKKSYKCSECGTVICKAAKKCGSCKAKHQFKGGKRPAKHILEKVIWEKPTIKIAEEYGVSDKAVEKWCKHYSIEKPPRGYWVKLKYGSIV